MTAPALVLSANPATLTMSFREWNDKVSPHLREIEDVAVSLDMRCRWLTASMGNLPARPSFPTKADAALEQAEAALVTTLAQVRALRVLYVEKPVIVMAGE